MKLAALSVLVWAPLSIMPLAFLGLQVEHQ